MTSGEDVRLEVYHTLLTGQTGLSGKTTTTLSLLDQVVGRGYTALVFDSKPTRREFLGFHDVPVCYRATNDPLILMPLLESIFQGRKLTREFTVLSRITETGSDLLDFAQNAVEMEKLSRSGWVKDAAHKLANLLRRLDKELKGLDLVEDLALEKGSVNVMPLNRMSPDAQQLVVKTAFELALKFWPRRLILVLDEAFRFLPQKRGSACKFAIQDLITQGAATELFVWMNTQFLVTTEKDPMRAMPNKILGRQDHNLEIEATLELIPPRVKITTDDIMSLHKGEFIFVPLDPDAPVRKVYVYPPAKVPPRAARPEVVELIPTESLPVPADFESRVRNIEAALDRLGV